MTEPENKTDGYLIKIASKRIEKQLDKIPRKDYSNIRIKILELSKNPRPYGVKKLSDNVHRIRIGDYRVVYSIFDKQKMVLIDKVARRSESTYKDQ